MSRREEEPEWLKETSSYPGEDRIQRWQTAKERQFVVLPFYADGAIEPGKELYMLWARALSDQRLYPVPHHWYSMALLHDTRNWGDGSHTSYRWVCFTHDDTGTVRMELNVSQAVINDTEHTAILRVDPDSTVTPEPVARSLGTDTRPATVFYRDLGLWANRPRLHDTDLAFGMDPLSLAHTGHPGIYGPVETYWAGPQEIKIRGASTTLWNRRDAPRPEDCLCQDA